MKTQKDNCVKTWHKNKTETRTKPDVNNLHAKAVLKIMTKENSQKKLRCSPAPNTVTVGSWGHKERQMHVSISTANSKKLWRPRCFLVTTRFQNLTKLSFQGIPVFNSASAWQGKSKRKKPMTSGAKDQDNYQS